MHRLGNQFSAFNSSGPFSRMIWTYTINQYSPANCNKNHVSSLIFIKFFCRALKNLFECSRSKARFSRAPAYYLPGCKCSLFLSTHISPFSGAHLLKKVNQRWKNVLNSEQSCLWIYSPQSVMIYSLKVFLRPSFPFNAVFLMNQCQIVYSMKWLVIPSHVSLPD